MTPEEARGRQLAHRSLVGLAWFLVEASILGVALKFASEQNMLVAWPLGVGVILLSYFEGRFRK